MAESGKKGRREGRTNNLYYYLIGGIRMMLPRFVRRWQRQLLLRGWEKRPDADYIRDRVDFYCRLPQGSALGPKARRIRDFKLKGTRSRYYFDLGRYIKGFPGDALVDYMTTDVWHNPDTPMLMKARRLDDKAGNAALLNLNCRRHFIRPVDPVPLRDKKPVLFFRGEIDGKPRRIKFFEMWADSPLCDLGDTTRKNRSKWFSPMVSLTDHFDYQFILALEGNDLASALQWVMASNCVPVMPRPTAEGWLMHSRLIPGVHYIDISPDFTDVGEKIEYYKAHPDEAEKISAASREWAAQFLDRKRESIISYLVVERFLRSTGSLR